MALIKWHGTSSELDHVAKLRVGKRGERFICSRIVHEVPLPVRNTHAADGWSLVLHVNYSPELLPRDPRRQYENSRQPRPGASSMRSGQRWLGRMAGQAN